jgi:hypothetical protein
LSLFFMMCVKEILRLGRRYPFPRPERCLHAGCGSSRIWGHGFVERYFDGCDAPVELRRWRCPDCGCVYTIQPADYWPRHHTPIETITQGLSYRIKHGFWDKALGFTRQRQGHWLRALRDNIKMRLGMSFNGGMLAGFYELVLLPMVPIVRTG